MQSGGEYLLRPFQCLQEQLGVVLRVEHSHYFVGTISLGDMAKLPSNKAASMKRAEELASSLYSKEDIKGLVSRSKVLWAWNVGESEPLSKRFELTWVDARFKNRLFKLDPSKFLQATPNGPKSLDLKETAACMLNRLPSETWQVVSQQLQKLHGRTLRVGTTCSGSDICISVIKQTLEYLEATQAGEV